MTLAYLCSGIGFALLLWGAGMAWAHRIERRECSCGPYAGTHQRRWRNAFCDCRCHR